MKIKSKEKYYILKSSVRHLIKLFGDELTVFVYFYKDLRNIISISLEFEDYYNENILIYSTTLKNLYLYLFSIDYKNIEQSILVYFANKELKKYQSLDIRILLDITENQLIKFEEGFSDFKGKLSYENLANKMGFDKDEFTRSFINEFKKVKNGK